MDCNWCGRVMVNIFCGVCGSWYSYEFPVKGIRCIMIWLRHSHARIAHSIHVQNEIPRSNGHHTVAAMQIKSYVKSIKFKSWIFCSQIQIGLIQQAVEFWLLWDYEKIRRFWMLNENFMYFCQRALCLLCRNEWIPTTIRLHSWLCYAHNTLSTCKLNIS